MGIPKQQEQEEASRGTQLTLLEKRLRSLSNRTWTGNVGKLKHALHHRKGTVRAHGDLGNYFSVFDVDDEV